jgi:hypothetical protein
MGQTSMATTNMPLYLRLFPMASSQTCFAAGTKPGAGADSKQPSKFPFCSCRGPTEI